MKKHIFKTLLLSTSLLCAFNVMAEPRTVSTNITNLRPYTTGDYFVTLATADIADGSTCNRTYRVQSNDPGAKGVIASVLTAYALGQDIQIEIPTATGCEGFGTPIQSIIMAQ